MGCMMTNNKYFSEKLKYLQNAMGVIPSPFDCYLVNRSIKTLKLRMLKHQDNAIKLVELLEKHPKIKKVLYPKQIPKQMLGTGGMISFYLDGNLDDVTSFLNNLKMIPIAESLGGVESLIEHPGLMTHASVDSEERQKYGITDNLIRLSVGLEELDDIYNDINQALS
jgi:cystathionine beta-lyase/cystathionine gamma-synthase